MKMTAGLHSVVVEYFEQDGDEALQVDFEGPGRPQQPLATLLDRARQRKRAPPRRRSSFTIDPAKAAKGTRVFRVARLRVVPRAEDRRHGGRFDQVSAPPLSQLERPRRLPGRASPAKSPRYALERAADGRRSPPPLPPRKRQPRSCRPTESIDRTLVRFNCIACHERDKLGGVEEARNRFFQSDMPEMGDEGRIPPQPDRRRRQAQRRVAEDRVRPRGQGPALHAHADAEVRHGQRRQPGRRARSRPTQRSIKPRRRSTSPPTTRRIKAAGRRLVGAQGFSCIKCHTFADKRSTGIQAISLTTMTKRLRPEWFHHYLHNPLAYRPGTRMPTPFPDGKTTLPDVLDGSVDKQIAAIWTYLADGDKATLPVGLVTGKIELIAFDEAIIYRNFIEGAGTRAIGVGYPEKLNLAFDANELRLAMLWHGGVHRRRQALDRPRRRLRTAARRQRPATCPTGAPFAVLDRRRRRVARTRRPRSWATSSAATGSARRRRPTFLYSLGGRADRGLPAAGRRAGRVRRCSAR